jgi:hypothetical protein
MKWMLMTLIGAGALSGSTASTAPLSGQAEGEAAPIYGIKLPQGYRDWRLMSVKQLTGDKQISGKSGELRQLRAELANDVAIAAIRQGKLPYPDGSIIAALHWTQVSAEEDDKVLAQGFPGVGLKSYYAGDAVNVQFMVKDSKKYTSTGGWGFADFVNGKPNTLAVHQKCFSCHLPIKDRDFVFTRYAPTP